MVTHDPTNETATEVVTLKAPERLEPRLAPMFMCCGTWGYGFSIGLGGPSISITWTEDSGAACNQ
jgi:hypothetical protein